MLEKFYETSKKLLKRVETFELKTITKILYEKE